MDFDSNQIPESTNPGTNFDFPESENNIEQNMNENNKFRFNE